LVSFNNPNVLILLLSVINIYYVCHIKTPNSYDLELFSHADANFYFMGVYLFT